MQILKNNPNTMKSDNNTSREEQLESLRQAMLDDPQINQSSLARTAANLVWGEGGLKAGLIFIGEAPGALEDKLARPFVGRAGELLNTFLEELNLSRETDVWITNLVKHRPPGNRDPSDAEKELYAPYIAREIAIIKPNLVVTLGRHAGVYFIDNLRISSEHGRPRNIKYDFDGEWGELAIMPLYHPAAVLYNSQLMPVFREDFIKLKEFI